MTAQADFWLPVGLGGGLLRGEVLVVEKLAEGDEFLARPGPQLVLVGLAGGVEGGVVGGVTAEPGQVGAGEASGVSRAAASSVTEREAPTPP